MAETQDLEQLHLADLHLRAAEAGIDRFRMLTRDDLIAALEGEDGEKPRRRRRRGGRGDREKLSGSGREAKRQTKDVSEEETEEVTGVLEITRQRHGFLSIEGVDDDVYVSASQVRRCELKDGDEVTGPVRAPRRGERHRALVRVELVNGEEPVEGPARSRGGSGAPKSDAFDALTPVPPSRRIQLPADADTLVRAADLLAPLAHGQRVLVKAAPRAGRTTYLRALARALAEVEGVDLTVLLVDERPEELPAWRDAVPSAELALAPADLSPAAQTKVARDALDRARHEAAGGADAIVLCDSLSRLAVAARGVDDVKRLFGSGRELAEDGAGSLTVVATTLGDSVDDGAAEKAVATTETALVSLDASLAAEGITPALRFQECHAVGVAEILSEGELEELRALRSELGKLSPPEAAALLRDRLEG
jgi:transcription termination factor Rho